MPVTILDAFLQQDDFGTNGLTFAPSAGSNRVAVITVGAEANGGNGIGISAMTLGGESCVAQREAIVGSVTAYHNYNAIWTLNEAGIAAMTGSTLLITWVNFSGQGPFETSPVVHYGSYQDVDQANIKSAEGGNTNTSASTITLAATMNVAVDEKVVVNFVVGQPNTPSSSAGGLTEETQYVGGSNDMSMAVYHRTATTADASYNCTVDASAATRLNVQAIALGFGAVSISHEQESFKFYNDGTESGSGDLAAQDVSITIDKETTFGIRVGTQIVGDPAGVTLTVEVKESGDPDSEYRKLL